MKRSKEKAEELLGVSGFHRLQNELTKETVNHPEHYLGNKFEAIEIIEDYNLNFNLGNVIKYTLRADKKGKKAEDLKKAKWYIERELVNIADVNQLDEQMSLETETNENVHNSDHLIEVYNEAYDRWFKNSDQLINGDRAHDFAIAVVMLESNPLLTGGH